MHRIFTIGILILTHSFLLEMLFIPFHAHSQKFTDRQVQSINSAYDEQSPCISPDGNSIYFTIAYHPENVGGKKDPGDIWVSNWDGEKWLPPTNLNSPINNADYNAVLGFSETGEKIFLTGRYSETKTGNSYQGIAISTKTISGWSTPENVSIPYFVNYASHLSGFINAYNNQAFFSIQSFGSYGSEDIYFSLLENDSWTSPLHLGKEINTKLQELSPYLSEDGQSLYFSTNSKKGFGSFDIYISNQIPSNPIQWSKPVNLGDRINTKGRELYFKMYKKWNIGIYTSTINSDGYGDIRIFVPDVLPEIKQDTSVVEASNSVPEINIVPKQNIANGNFMSIKGTIKDGITGRSVRAKVIFTSDSNFEAPLDSQYYLIIPKNKVYNVTVVAEGYIESFEKVDLINQQLDSTEINFELQPITVGSKVKLKNVIFKRSTAVLLPSSFDELDGVVHFLNTHPTVKIMLGGHTDNSGNPALNVQLSRRRVERVKTYLVSKGISETRITGKGYGGSMPIASGDSEEMRSRNRRVEFIIVDQ